MARKLYNSISALCKFLFQNECFHSIVNARIPSIRLLIHSFDVTLSLTFHQAPLFSRELRHAFTFSRNSYKRKISKKFFYLHKNFVEFHLFTVQNWQWNIYIVQRTTIFIQSSYLRTGCRAWEIHRVLSLISSAKEQSWMDNKGKRK